MAAGLWGKAGQRSLGRSALMEAVAQFTRALDQIAALPATPALRQEQIKFQVALANTVMNVKGYAAPDARAALEQARAYIEEIQALEEPLEDPSLFFSVLSGFWAASLNAFNGDVMCELAAQYLALAERQGEPSRGWWGIASWDNPSCARGISSKVERTSIAQSRFTILLSIVR